MMRAYPPSMWNPQPRAWVPGETLGRYGSSRQGGAQKARLYPIVPSEKVILSQPYKDGPRPGLGYLGDLGWTSRALPETEEATAISDAKWHKYMRMTYVMHRTVDGEEWRSVPFIREAIKKKRGLVMEIFRKGVKSK